MKGAVADLLGVLQDVANVRAGREVQADQLPQKVGIGLRLLLAQIVDEQRHQAVFDLLAGCVHAVAVVDLPVPGDEVTQQAVGLVQALWGGAGPEDERSLGACLGPAVELVQQPALAHAGLGHDGDALQPCARLQHAPEGVLQQGEFGIAADHLRLDALDAARDNAEGARL